MSKIQRLVLASGIVAATLGSVSLASAGEEAKKGVSFEVGTPPFADVLAKAKAASKPVFLDFFTDW